MEVLATCAAVTPIPRLNVSAALVVPLETALASADLGAILDAALPIARVATNSMPASIAANDMAYSFASSLEYTRLPFWSRLLINSRYLLPNDILYISYAISAEPNHLAPVIAVGIAAEPPLTTPPPIPPITPPTIAPAPPCLPIMYI